MCMYTLLSVLKCFLVLHENTHVLIRVFVFARMLAKERFLAKSCRHEGTHCREQVDNVRDTSLFVCLHVVIINLLQVPGTNDINKELTLFTL